jgi:uncharacterized protein YkwD
MSSATRAPRPARLRSKFGHLAGALLLTTLGVGIGQSAVSASAGAVATSPSAEIQLAPGAVPYNAQYDVMNAVNRMRRSFGLPSLYRAAALSRACSKHAQDMAARQVMSHIGSDGSNGGQRIRREGFSWRIWGENVAAGYTSAESVVQGWMNSAGHRAIILDRRFQYIGVGVAQARNGVLYWCMNTVGR